VHFPAHSRTKKLAALGEGRVISFGEHVPRGDKAGPFVTACMAESTSARLLEACKHRDHEAVTRLAPIVTGGVTAAHIHAALRPGERSGRVMQTLVALAQPDVLNDALVLEKCRKVGLCGVMSEDSTIVSPSSSSLVSSRLWVLWRSGSTSSHLRS
jgi:hypothetical protein